MMPPKGYTLTILPPKEGYSQENAGAIALLASRFLQSDEWVAGYVRSYDDFASKKEHLLFPSHFIPVFPEKCFFGKARQYCAGLKKIIQKTHPASIEVHNRPEIALYLARAFPQLKFTLFLHNDPQEMRKAKKVKAREKLVKYVQVIAVSHWLKQRFIEDMSVSGAQRVRVIPNAIDFTTLPTPFPINRRKKYIIYAGRIVADKGVDLLAKAWTLARPALPGWEVIMIGADRFSTISPETPFLAHFRTQAEQNGIRLVGYKSHSYVVEMMAQSAIVVVPSRWAEPFGMTALEAMACGAAVIASGRGGLGEVVGEGGILINPEDTYAFANMLIRVAQDELLQSTLSEKGKMQAKCFSLQHILPQRLALRA